MKLFKTVARQQVFNHPEVEQLELQGYRVIKGLLEIYQSLMLLDYEQFTTLMNDDFLPKYPIETRLFHKLSGKHRKAYQQQMRTLIVEHKISAFVVGALLPFALDSGLYQRNDRQLCMG